MGRDAFSISRLKVLRRCPRAFRHSYLSAWTERDVRQMKALGSRALLIGSTVHRAAKLALQALQAGRLPDQQKLIAAMVAEAQYSVVAARSAFATTHADAIGAMEEIFYDTVNDDAYWNDGYAQIERLLRNFFACGMWERLTRRLIDEAGRVAQLIEIDEDLSDQPDIDIDGTTLLVKIDALVRHHGDKYGIIDWKTGRRDRAADLQEQGRVYALAVSERYAAPAANIVAEFVNVATNETKRLTFTEADLDEARDLVVRTTNDVGTLIALNGTAADAWPMLSPDKSSRCRWCSFRRACGREGGGNAAPTLIRDNETSE